MPAFTGRNLGEQVQVPLAHVGPEHGPGITIGLVPRLALERCVREESQCRIGHGFAPAEGHKQAAAVGQDFLGVQVRRADHSAPAAIA